MALDRSGELLVTDSDGRPLRCAGAGLVDVDVFACCESKPTNARFMAYDGWCLWLPLCEAHLALFDSDVAAELEPYEEKKAA